MSTRRTALAGLSGLALAGWFGIGRGTADAADASVFPVTRTDPEWRRMLTPAQYEILRHHGTEPPESSPLDHEVRPGTYACIGCAQPVFSGQTKFDSGTGWPSFWAPLSGAVATTTDRSLGMARTEVHCANCGGHLGHVFADGPPPTGLRYCMNGAALSFQPQAA